MKVTMGRTRGKDARRKNCEESVYECPRRKNIRWNAPRKRRLDDAENDLKKIGVRRWEKIVRDRHA
jgi:hypothetical protein